MTKIIFITYPSVVVEKNMPVHKWRIAEKGMFEIRQLLKKPFWSEVKSIYTSDQSKVAVTAEIIGKQCKCRVVKEKCLVEIDRRSTGYIDKDEYLEAMKEFYQYPYDSYKGWETAAHAMLRISDCVSNIAKKHKDQTIAIIGHGATGTLLACHIKSITPTYELDPKQTGVYMIIDWDTKEIISPWEKY